MRVIVHMTMAWIGLTALSAGETNLLPMLADAGLYGRELPGASMNLNGDRLTVIAPANAANPWSIGASFALGAELKPATRYRLTVPIGVGSGDTRRIELTIALTLETAPQTYRDVWLRDEVVTADRTLKYHFIARDAIPAQRTRLVVHCGRKAQAVVIRQPSLVEHPGPSGGATVPLYLK